MVKTPSQHHKKSFTLIELLIVITIIGILAVALVPRIMGGAPRARDVKRKADLQNIITALSLYYSDNGSYPIDTGNNIPSEGCIGDGTAWLDDAIKPYLAGEKIPADPNGATAITCTGYYYYRALPATASSSTASGVMLVADLETDATSPQDGYYCTSGSNNLSATNWANLPAAQQDLDSLAACSGSSTPTNSNAFYVTTH